MQKVLIFDFKVEKVDFAKKCNFQAVFEKSRHIHTLIRMLLQIKKTTQNVLRHTYLFVEEDAGPY